METKEYLRNVMELEQAVYTINRTTGYLKYGIRNLGIEKSYEEPKKPREYNGISAVFTAGYAAVLSTGIGVPASIIYGLIRWIYYGNKFGTNFVGCLLICMGIVFLGTFLVILCASDTSSKYDEELERYNKLVEDDKIRVSNELAQKERICSQITMLSLKRKEIMETLTKLYDMNVIYPKYRNFVAVTTFYEYFESGRCNKLQGHEGAYNIYESEIRLNVIIAKLDDIIERLDEIRSNQYAIHNAVSEGNRIANNIYQQAIKNSKKIDLLNENSAITSYNNMITARNSEILKNIAVYKMIKE